MSNQKQIIMAKVAKLVYLSMVTRVIVDEDAREEEIVEASRENFIRKVNLELGENTGEIIDDIECPYDPDLDILQPQV
jgi:hypothetical protein